MQLAPVDWAIMAAFFLISLVIGVAVSRSAGKNFSSFFLGGQKLPWWLLGISMVATTFSTDTPNLVTDIVRSNGTFGNWVWWAFLLTGMVTVFLYAKLWRRSGVLTDVAFYEIRYSGRLAAFLRGFRAIYLGVLFNIIIMASVTLAAIKIGGVMLQWTPEKTILIAASITLVYSALGGLRGVVLTDMIQFAMAMVGSIWATIYILGLPEVGGLSSLLDHPNVEGSLAFLPSFSEMSWEHIVPIFIIPLSVQWWSVYYPGAEPGGGGYIVQRMLSAKDEKHAVGATLLFNGLHYALRPWPWILVALASLVVFPDLGSIKTAFPHIEDQILKNDLAYPAMLTLLPAGLLGLVVTSLAAAYMSTMSTQVNWGSSIIVHDVYHRFINPNASDAQLVWAGRLATAGLMVVACILALYIENALQVFTLVLQIGAGTGLLFILRWFWWRINAASELTAMIVSFLVAVFFAQVDTGLADWQQLLTGVGITTLCWVLVAYLTAPTDDETLISFCTKIRPGGPGWQKIKNRAAEKGITIPDAAPEELPYGILAALLGTISIFSFLFATGFTIYGNLAVAAVLVVVSAGCAIGIFKIWPMLRFS